MKDRGKQKIDNCHEHISCDDGRKVGRDCVRVSCMMAEINVHIDEGYAAGRK